MEYKGSGVSLTATSRFIGTFLPMSFLKKYISVDPTPLIYEVRSLILVFPKPLIYEVRSLILVCLASLLHCPYLFGPAAAAGPKQGFH